MLFIELDLPKTKRVIRLEKMPVVCTQIVK